MPRIALGLEYDGTDFVGWQIQQVGRSVEGVLASAVGQVAGEAVNVHGSGRTDAGVHALHQVAHFDAAAARTQRQWLLGINSNLPPDVAVRWVWWVREPLDCAAMTAAATSWLGERDFSSFRAAGCQARSPNRRLIAVQITQRPQGSGVLVTCEFTANAFLQHMVRNFVGTLVAIGRGSLPPSAAADILARRDRKEAGVAAPPAGLALVEVLYPPHYEVPRYADDA